MTHKNDSKKQNNKRDSKKYRSDDSSSDSEESSDSENSHSNSNISLSETSSTNASSKVTNTYTSSGTNTDSHTITARLDFINNLVRDIDLKPLIQITSNEYDYVETEKFTQNKIAHKCKDKDCQDIRCMTGKRLIDIKHYFTKYHYEMKYIKSGATGHTFKAVSERNPETQFAIKVVAFPAKSDEDDADNGNGRRYDIKRPENAEIMMIRLLSYFVVNRLTPHIVLPIATFDTHIKHFVTLSPKDTIGTNKKNQDRYMKFVEQEKKGLFHDKVSILISEWVNGGDLLDYIKKNHKNVTQMQWRVIFFQILSVLAIIQDKYPSFRHNDLKPNNILIQILDNNTETVFYEYIIGNNRYYVPNVGVMIKIWDFDFACIPGIVENNKVKADWTNDRLNVKERRHRYYDMHYFFNTLMEPGFFEDFSKLPKKVIEFVHRMVPECYRRGQPDVTDKCRLKRNHEYLTPTKVLSNDPFFNKFRLK
jgi:hypothetical protein